MKNIIALMGLFASYAFPQFAAAESTKNPAFYAWPLGQYDFCTRGKSEIGNMAFYLNSKKIEVFEGGTFFLQVRYLRCTQISDAVLPVAVEFPKDGRVEIVQAKSGFWTSKFKSEEILRDPENLEH